MITVNINNIYNYDSIIAYYFTCSEYNKFAPIPNIKDNPAGCANFWRLYKKKSKNIDAQQRWNKIFHDAKVWKNPKDDSWRIYFNQYSKKEKDEKDEITICGMRFNKRDLE